MHWLMEVDPFFFCNAEVALLALVARVGGTISHPHMHPFGDSRG